MKHENLHERDKQIQHTSDDRVQHSSSMPYRCANCDIEFLWTPTSAGEKVYCCSGCAAGGPCCCDYSNYSSTTISGVVHYGPEEEKRSVDVQMS